MYIQPWTLVVSLGLTVMVLALASAASKDKYGGGVVAMLILVSGLTVIWAPILFPDAWAAFNGN
jgi:hypothetical protein